MEEQNETTIKAGGYSFEEFNAQSKRFNLMISISRLKRFGLSSGFVQKYGISEKKGVKFLYDKHHKVIALRFLDTEEEGSTDVNVFGEAGKEGGAIINAKPFFTMYDIDANKYAGRYVPKEATTEKGKVFIMELEKQQ